MKFSLKSFCGIAVLALCATQSLAATISPAVVYDQAGKYDKSFNEAAFRGAERFQKDTGIKYHDATITSDAQKEQILRDMARRHYDPVVAVGFSYTQAVETVAKEFPKTRFILIDTVAKGPNIESIIFKEQEGAFLVGMAAAMKSKTGTIGFIGGMDVPLARAFACGYLQGARYVNPQVKVLQNMAGTTAAAFNDPARGAELTKSQIDRGADVVFAAAGGTGVGVLQAAKTAGKFSIGVDNNQNYMQPGSVLTSMVKKVDVAVYNAFKAAQNNTWKAGTQVLGLKDNGVDWTLDNYNRALITPAMEKRMNQARQEIMVGKIKVVDYRTNNSCPIK